MILFKLEVHNPKPNIEIKDIRLFPNSDANLSRKSYWLDFRLTQRYFDNQSKSMKFVYVVNGIFNPQFDFVDAQFFDDMCDLLKDIEDIECTVKDLQEAYRDGMRLHLLSKPVMKATLDNINVTHKTKIVEEE